MTPAELDAWVEGMKAGYATTEALPLFVESYKELWRTVHGDPEPPAAREERQLSFL